MALAFKARAMLPITKMSDTEEVLGPSDLAFAEAAMQSRGLSGIG
jgi:hypothetical protein